MPEMGWGADAGKGLSVTRIQQLHSQGLTNNQIIQTLQRDGFKSSEIFDVLNQASIQTTAPGMGASSPQPLNTAQPSSAPMAPPPQAPPSIPAMPPSGPPMGPPMGGGASDEELIEAIIDEKWNDLLQDINKIIAWKDRTSQQITAMEQQVKDLKDQFEKLHSAVVGKVGEYDQHILQVGAEVKAMEKVFSKVLPVFTENVAELSRVADTMKGGRVRPATRAPVKTVRK